MNRPTPTGPAEPVILLFASQAGDPLHLKVTVCPRCACLVALAEGARHTAWHADQRDAQTEETQ